MKFCHDCNFHLRPSAVMALTSELAPAMDFTRCGHPHASDFSQFLVTGSIADIRQRYASIERTQSAACGPGGANWTPSEEYRARQSRIAESHALGDKT